MRVRSREVLRRHPVPWGMRNRGGGWARLHLGHDPVPLGIDHGDLVRLLVLILGLGRAEEGRAGHRARGLAWTPRRAAAASLQARHHARPVCGRQTSPGPPWSPGPRRGCRAGTCTEERGGEEGRTHLAAGGVSPFGLRWRGRVVHVLVVRIELDRDGDEGDGLGVVVFVNVEEASDGAQAPRVRAHKAASRGWLVGSMSGSGGRVLCRAYLGARSTRPGGGSSKRCS